MTQWQSLVTRRGFLGLVALVATGLGVGCKDSSSNQDRQLKDNTDPIVAILRRKFGYLDMDEPGMRAYATEWLDRTQGRLSALSYNEDLVASYFLLSSDFFLHQEDETRVIQYVSLHDPRFGCRNPFARFDA